jgi:hypothetical protein
MPHDRADPGPGAGPGGRHDGPTVSGKLRVVLCWHMHQPQYRD